MKVIDDDDDAFDDDERKTIWKKRSVSQTRDQVMTIKTHTESPRTELSSKGKRPLKVWRFFQIQNFPLMLRVIFEYSSNMLVNNIFRKAIW